MSHSPGWESSAAFEATFRPRPSLREVVPPVPVPVLVLVLVLAPLLPSVILAPTITTLLPLRDVSSADPWGKVDHAVELAAAAAAACFGPAGGLPEVATCCDGLSGSAFGVRVVF